MATGSTITSGLAWWCSDMVLPVSRAFQNAAKKAGKYDGDLDGDYGPKTRSATLLLVDLAPR